MLYLEYSDNSIHVQKIIHTFKKKYKIKFNRIIGIAGWGFDHFFEGYYKNCIDNYSEDDVNNFKDSLGAVNQGYLEVVKKYPDILFILKMHPLLVNMEYSEFKGLEQFENVLLLKSEENIYDIIHVCDLWIAFESTTFGFRGTPIHFIYRERKEK